MHQASEDMQRCTLGLYDDDTGPFPLSNVQVRLVLKFAAQSAVQHLQARPMHTCHAYVHGPHAMLGCPHASTAGAGSFVP